MSGNVLSAEIQEDLAKPSTAEAVSKALNDGSLMTMTLVGATGFGVTLDDLGSLCRHWDGLMKAIGKEVDPKLSVEWRVVSLAVIDDTVKVGIRPQPRRPRRRRTSR